MVMEARGVRAKICPNVLREAGIEKLIRFQHGKTLGWADEKRGIVFNNDGGVVAGKEKFPNGVFFHGNHPVWFDPNRQAIGELSRPVRWTLHPNNIKTPSPRLTLYPLDLKGARLSIMFVHSLIEGQERIDNEELAWPRFEASLKTLPENVLKGARSVLAVDPRDPSLIARWQPRLSVRLAEGFREGMKNTGFMIDYAELVTGFLPVDERRSVRVGQLVLYPA